MVYNAIPLGESDCQAVPATDVGSLCLEISSFFSYDSVYEPLVQYVLRHLLRAISNYDVIYSGTPYMPSLQVSDESLYLVYDKKISHVDANVRKPPEHYLSKITGALMDSDAFRLVKEGLTVQNDYVDDDAILTALCNIFLSDTDAIGNDSAFFEGLYRSLRYRVLKHLYEERKTSGGATEIAFSGMESLADLLREASRAPIDIDSPSHSEAVSPVSSYSKKSPRSAIAKGIFSRLGRNSYAEISTTSHIFAMKPGALQMMNDVIAAVLAFVQDRGFLSLSAMWDNLSSKPAATASVFFQKAQDGKLKDYDIYNFVEALVEQRLYDNALDKNARNDYLNDKSLLLNLLRATLVVAQKYDWSVARAVHNFMGQCDLHDPDKYHSKNRLKNRVSAALKILIDRGNTDVINDLSGRCTTINVAGLQPDDQQGRLDLLRDAMSTYLSQLGDVLADSDRNMVIVAGKKYRLSVKSLLLDDKIAGERFPLGGAADERLGFFDSLKTNLSDSPLASLLERKDRSKSKTKLLPTTIGAFLRSHRADLVAMLGQSPFVAQDIKNALDVGSQDFDLLGEIYSFLTNDVRAGKNGNYEDCKFKIAFELIDENGDALDELYYVEQMFVFSDNENQVTHDSVLDPQKFINALARIAGGVSFDRALRCLDKGFDRMLAELHATLRNQGLQPWVRNGLVNGFRHLVLGDGTGEDLVVDVFSCLPGQPDALKNTQKAKEDVARYFLRREIAQGNLILSIYGDQFDSVSGLEGTTESFCDFVTFSLQEPSVETKPQIPAGDLHNGKIFEHLAYSLVSGKKHFVIHLSNGKSMLLPGFLACRLVREYRAYQKSGGVMLAAA